MIKVAVLVGSLRKESFNRKMAKHLVAIAAGQAQLSITEIGDLPWYDEDRESTATPAEWLRFRRDVAHQDAVLFITPEYNRSIPGALKNAIDVGSRPYGKSVWDKKPGAVMSVSPGPLGGFGANHHLRQSLVFLNVPCMQQPEAYVGNAAKLFDPEGNIINEVTREFAQKFLTAFLDWIRVHSPH